VKGTLNADEKLPFIPSAAKNPYRPRGCSGGAVVLDEETGIHQQSCTAECFFVVVGFPHCRSG
jgi:hypothetical protein